MCIALAIASLLAVAYQGVAHQLRVLDLRIAETHALRMSAIALCRAVVDHPDLATQPHELEHQLARLEGTSRGERVEIDRRPTTELVADVLTITVSRTHPLLGRCEGRAAVMLDGVLP
jgi:hypothetical protein